MGGPGQEPPKVAAAAIDWKKVQRRRAITQGMHREMGDATFEFWTRIGERLAMGEKLYGGFNFSSYDLDKMSKEELEDFVVYKLYDRLYGRTDNGG